MAELQNKDVTQLLQAWSSGNQEALERLLPLVYEELRQLAERSMRKERREHTLQPTALVHEAYLRLVDQTRMQWRNRSQFFGLASQLMRRILVDHARQRQVAKRGGGALRIELDENLATDGSGDEDLLLLDLALRKLSEFDERKGRVIEMRIFGGLTIEETATALNISTGTVINEYRAGRAWLFREIQVGRAPEGGR